MTDADDQDLWRKAKLWLAGGIVLRFITAVVQAPLNRDFHLGVIIRIINTGRLPISNATDQSYHPPLYYLLAAPILALTHRPKVVQLLSLAFALATLVVLFLLTVRSPLFGSQRERLWTFALLAVQPQLIAYGLFISNDTLATLIGATCCWLLWRWLEQPSAARLRLLGLACGAGLLTKASFLGFAAVFACVVPVMTYRFDRATAARRTLEFLALVVVIGSYKYVENLWYFGTLSVTPFDVGADWIVEQAQGRHLPGAYFGTAVRSLFFDPTGNSRQPYAAMLFRSFWIEYLPMSNLVLARRWPFFLPGSGALILAIVPTVLMAAGVVEGLVTLPRWLFRRNAPDRDARIAIGTRLPIVVLVSILAIMTVEEFRWHAWSIMHARLLLPACAGAFAAFGIGWSRLRALVGTAADRFVVPVLAVLVTLLLVQQVIDIALFLGSRV
jgi:4-amino-4-deoxy-L-arabinose transferase-like glycosyltransferase